MKTQFIAGITLFSLHFAILSEGAVKKKEAHGRVVSIVDNYIELKSGGREYILYVTDETVVMYNEKKSDLEQIELCQRVSAVYTVIDGDSIIIQLTILKDSDCIQ